MITSTAALKDTFSITETCLRQIEATVGSKPPEMGMLLGGSRNDWVVRHVYLDQTAERTAATYSPDHVTLTQLLKEWWNPSAISLLGFIHSHPGRYTRLSDGDLRYAGEILKRNPELSKLLLPIVTLDPFTLHPYVVERSGETVEWRAVPLRVFREELTDEAPATKPSSRALPKWLDLLINRPQPKPWWEGESFARVHGAYDLPRLARTRLLIVGTGGAIAWAEEMARCGIGSFALIDPDSVSLTNIGTQQVYRNEVGRPKVEVLRDRIRRINPKATVVALRKVLDEFSDDDIACAAGLHEMEPPVVTLLCAMTDSFYAQARMNRLALKLRLPLIAAQLYAEGRGVEVVWSYPGVSQTCHRCVLTPRYRAYLEEGFTNDVTSAGTPIFSTTRLNSLKGFVALSLLHHGSNHPRWGNMLDRIGQRTLIQVRLHPDLELPAFRKAFGDNPRTFCDEALWITPEPSIQMRCRRVNEWGCSDCFGGEAATHGIHSDGDTRHIRAQ